jgi:hypothetical protein
MNFEEIKQEIKDQCISISEIYSDEDLRGDPEFGKLYVEYDETKAEHERLTQAKTERKTELDSSGDRLDKLLETGHTESEKTYVKRQFDREKEKIADLTDKGIADFIENSKERFAEDKILFGAYDAEQEALIELNVIPGKSSISEPKDSRVEQAVKIVTGEVNDDEANNAEAEALKEIGVT